MPGRAENKPSRLMIVDSDSYELPDLASGLDHDGKDEGSMEESEGGIGEDSDRSEERRVGKECA